MKFQLTIIIFFISISFCFGQAAVFDGTNISTISGIFTTSSVVSEKHYEKKLLGSYYLTDDWALATIKLLGDTIILEGIPIKVDIMHNVIELEIDDEIKILPSYKTKSFVLKGDTREFVSRSYINLYGPTGFYDLLYDGYIKLYRYYTTKILESNYNDALGTGRRDDELIQEKTYYLTGKDNLMKLEQRKSKLIEQLSDYSGLEKFIKSNRIDVKSEMGLIEIVKFIESQ